MSNVITPKGYRPILNLKQTQHAIKKVKDFFEIVTYYVYGNDLFEQEIEKYKQI